MTLEECRRFYAEEVKLAANLKSAAVVEAFARVGRENFLGPGPWRIPSTDFIGKVVYTETEDDDPRRIYHNVAVALDMSRDLNNGQPATLARWIDELDLKPGNRVFHLGCGVGYFTAIIAEAVGASGQVVASEVDADLASRAQKNLASYANVEVRAEDGAALDPGDCDAILINAGVTHPHPAWLERLRDGGRLVLPLTVPMSAAGPTLGKGVMVKIVREGERFPARVFNFVAIYSCTSARDAQLEPLLGKAMMTGTLMKMRSLRRDVHEAGDTCVLHGAEICLSTAEAGRGQSP